MTLNRWLQGTINSTHMLRMMIAVLAAMSTAPTLADPPVSYTCTDDDAYKSVQTWYRNGENLQQMPVGSKPIPALTEMVIVTDTADELVATLPDLDPGVVYEWGITLATGRHWDTTTKDGAIVDRVFGTCVVND